MKTIQYDAIQRHPLYAEIRRKRRALIWPLSILMLVAYYAFITIIAFHPAVFSTPVMGGVTSLGILSGFGLILFTFLLTGIYSYVANTHIEPLNEQLRVAAGQEV